MKMSIAQMAKIIALVSGMAVGGYDEGMAAYYRDGLLREGCERRVTNGWTNGQMLDCSWPCLVAGIEHRELGAWYLVDVPGASTHI